MGNASVQRGLFFTFRLFSLIRHALRRATFPGGEGNLPAGEGTEAFFWPLRFLALYGTMSQK